MAARVLSGRYRLGRLLGRGGMAEVYEAHDVLLDRPVAVKLLRPDMAAEGDVRARFEIEARSAARLHHPNVVSVFDTGEDAGEPYLVMELLPGRTLADQVGEGPVSPEVLLPLAADILAALGAAHEAGLVHRDVKPGNVLLTADGNAKVADFGIAKSVEATASGDLTGTGLLLGTPAYLAPERVSGRPATPRSDLYSLGVVLYEALTGVKPFTGNSAMAVASAITSAPLPALDVARPGLEPRLVAAIERAMSRDPEDRPATAAEMAADLGLAGPADTTRPLAGATTADAPDSTLVGGPAVLGVPVAAAPAAVAALARRRRAVVATLAAAVLVLVFVLVVAAARRDEGAGPGTDALARRLEDLAERVEEGDGPRGPEATERLQEVAEQLRAGGGGGAATDLMRDAAGWRATGELSGSAFTEMVTLLRQVPRSDSSVLTTAVPTSTTAAPPPPPSEDEKDEKDDDKEEEKGKGKGRGM